MDFPILRTQLQALSIRNDTELFNQQIDEQVKNLVDKITKHILNYAECGERQYICKYPHYIFDVYFRKPVRTLLDKKEMIPILLSCGPNALKKCIVPEIMTELRRKFPDTTILTDPLNSYILIDWS